MNSDLMDTFPVWSDDDSCDLDGFLSSPWPDDDKSYSSSEGSWPEAFEDCWRSPGKIVSISALPSDEQAFQDDRNESVERMMGTEVRQAADTLTLSNMAGATADLAAALAYNYTPTKTQLLRKKLPMLLCKPPKMKQPSPGEHHVHFVDHSEEEEENVVPSRRNSTQKRKDEPNHLRSSVSSKSRPLPPAPHSPKAFGLRPPPKVPRSSTIVQELCFQDPQQPRAPPVEAYTGKCSPSNWIHNANLFYDKTLPNRDLDYLCRDSNLVGAERVPPSMEVSYSGDEENSETSSDSGKPSLPGGAVDTKLAHVFSLTSIQEDDDKRPITRAPSTDSSTVASDVPDYTPAKVSHLRPSGSKVADRQKWLQEAFKKPQVDANGKPAIAVSQVSGAIQKFGGKKPRKSAVQLRKQELERKLSLKEEKPVIKTRWEAQAGTYKKKVVISTNYH